MSQVKPKSKVYYRFRIFGWHVYISPRRLKLRDSDHGTSAGYKRARNARMKLTGRICEGCGCQLAQFGYVWRLMPEGDAERYNVENVRILCRDCNSKAVAEGKFQNRLAQEGGKA